MIKKPQTNDDAQLAVIFLFFIAIVFIGFYWMILGGVMESLTTTHNNLTQGTTPMTPLTQDRQDSLIFLQSVFNNIPIIAFILTIVSVVILALANKYQVV
jgi:hypothetical protein